MKIINPSVSLLWITPNAEKMIELAGRTCYKSEAKITEESADKFCRTLIKRGHFAMIEHGVASLRFIIDRGCCYDKDTMVLTNQGWKFFKDLNETELFYSLDNKNNLVLEKANKIINMPYNGNLLRFHSTQIDLWVTPNHNMWVFDHHKRSKNTKIWKFIEAKDCKNKRYKFFKSSNYTGKDCEFITVDSLLVNRGFYKKLYPALKYPSKEFMEFLGLWITDGCLDHRKVCSGGRIVISQTKLIGRKRIEELLNILKIKYSFKRNNYRIFSPQLYNFIKTNFIKNNDYKKTYYISIPNWIKNLSKECLESLLKGIILGDGTPHTRSNGHYVFTASKLFALDLVEIALKVGQCANIYESEPRNTGRKIQGKVKTYSVSIINTVETLYNKRNKTFELVPYNDLVYCVELNKFHKLYVMRNGKPCWSGNSHELVRHRICSYAQESSRYVNYKEGIEVVEPLNLDELSKAKWINAMIFAENTYKDLILAGIKPEIARSVLPTCLKTEIVVTTNFREWLKIFELRISKFAHSQINSIMSEAKEILKKECPNVFGDIE
jgi:hypothetical protein